MKGFSGKFMCQNTLNILSSCHNGDRIIFGFDRAMLLPTFTLRTLLIHIQNIELLALISSIKIMFFNSKYAEMSDKEYKKTQLLKCII